jgi:hypothetical protein
MLKKIPTRDDFPRLLLETLEFAKLKTEHDRMKNFVRVENGWVKSPAKNTLMLVHGIL